MFKDMFDNEIKPNDIIAYRNYSGIQMYYVRDVYPLSLGVLKIHRHWKTGEYKLVNRRSSIRPQNHAIIRMNNSNDLSDQFKDIYYQLEYKRLIELP